MASRFAEAGEEVIQQLMVSSENENTRKSTNYWSSVFAKWATARNENPKLEEYETKELDSVLSRFYAEIRREDSTDYEPDSLKVMQAALERYLKEKSYQKSILKDPEFQSSRKVLEGKARKLRESGKGKRPNKAKSLTKQQEEILWQSGQLGGKTPRSLINTMWWLLTQHLGLRGRQEHHGMSLEDFTIQTDDNGVEFITFAEGMTKTRQGGLHVKQRLVKPKMFATAQKERCPVSLFKLYVEKRPMELKTTGPFYLSVIDKPMTENVWYKKTPMGKNTIDSIMKSMKENSPLKDMCGGKKLTNHSARKTVVKKLKSGGVPKSEIKNITGHVSEQGLDDYDSGDEKEQRMMSNIIAGKSSPPRDALSQVFPLKPPNQLPFGSAHMFNFNNCQVTVNIAGDNSAQAQASISQTKPRPFKRILQLESDSE